MGPAAQPRRPGRNQRIDMAPVMTIGLMLLVSLGPLSGSARGQSLRDAVREHVEEGIEQSQERAKRDAQARGEQGEAARDKRESQPKNAGERTKPDSIRKGKPRRTKQRPGASAPDRSGEPDVRISIGGGIEGEDGEPPPKLPHRFLPDYVKADIKLGAGYRGWVPQQYDRVAVDVGHYFTWNVNVRARLFKFLALREGYYETNALAAPRTDEAAVLANAGSHIPKAAWLLGTLGFPILKIWEPIIRYEARSFRTRATPSAPVCIVPRRGAPADLADCPRTEEKLDIVSGFETLVLGVRYHPNRDPNVLDDEGVGKRPPLFFGVGLMSYDKPYQLVVEGDTLDELLFDARFRGAGLAFGTTLGGGLNRFKFSFDVQAGLGEVQLTEDLSLNEVIPSDWVVGYVQGNGTVSISIPLWKFPPTLMFQPSGTFGGAAFYLIDTQLDEGQPVTTPNVNWDFLWSAQANLVLAI